jgi:hypothetical protein
MKAVPMIFNTEMVKALLDGRKTVTRRPMKKQPEDSGDGFDWWPSDYHQSMLRVSNIESVECNNKRQFLKDCISEASPFGSIGDLLYVRETFCIGKIDECDAEHPADRNLFVSQCKGDNNYIPKQWLLDDGISIEDVTFKPSIHMPRRASRITLKITDVRIEKLNDLRKSHEQVRKEGFESWPQFKHVWESIYGQSHPNDYVWVIEFEVIHKNVDEVLREMEVAA